MFLIQQNFVLSSFSDFGDKTISIRPIRLTHQILYLKQYQAFCYNYYLMMMMVVGSYKEVTECWLHPIKLVVLYHFYTCLPKNKALRKKDGYQVSVYISELYILLLYNRYSISITQNSDIYVYEKNVYEKNVI